MLRLFLIFAILTLAEPCFLRHRHRCHSFHHHHHRHKSNTVNNLDQETTKSTLNVQETPGTELQAIQNVLMLLEEKLQKYCKKSVIPKELYGEDGYHLKYKLPEDVDLKVSVQIKNKLLHTLVTKKTDGNVTIIDHVKLLPDIVKPEDANWTLHATDVLKIIIPYKVALGKEFVQGCGAVNEDVIDVPSVLYPKIIYKFLKY